MAVTAAGERIARVEKAMELQLLDWHMAPAARALMGMRGFRVIAAMIVVSELGDIHRFEHPRQLMAYLGLVRREDSSGEKEKRGSITKAGNSHLRWIMNETKALAGAAVRLRRRSSPAGVSQPRGGRRINAPSITGWTPASASASANGKPRLTRASAKR